LHVSPAEAAEFVEWALLNNVFDDHMRTVLQAFAESRRRTFAEFRVWCENHYNELRQFESSRPPDQRDSAVIAGHKADKMDNVIYQLQLMERGE
jgi:hypothetical protein